MEENATAHSNVKESQSQQRGISTQTANGGKGGNRGGGIGRSNYQHQGGRSGGGRGGHHQHGTRGMHHAITGNVQSNRGRNLSGSLPLHDELFNFHLDGVPSYSEVSNSFCL